MPHLPRPTSSACASQPERARGLSVGARAASVGARAACAGVLARGR